MKLFQSKVQIGDKQYTVPERITVSQFEQVQSFGFDDAKSRIMCSAAIIGCSPKEIMQLDQDGQEMVYAMAMLSMTTLEKPVAKACPFDFDNMSFGQFIDLDVLTFEGIDTHLADIISILWDEDVDKVANSPLDLYLSGLTLWTNKRAAIYAAYATFFGLHDNTEQLAEDMGLDIEGADIRRIWYQAVITLAGEDFLKINQVVDRPVGEALNFLAYMKEQAQKRAQEERRRAAKMKIK